MEHDHSAALRAVRTTLPERERLLRLSKLFKVFGDVTRMQILFALYESELCVCALTELLQMDQSAVSHQLRVLKDVKFVRYRRDGKTVFYSLADEHIRTMIAQAYEHLSEDNDET